jgi:hypothetical protein
MKAKWVLRRKFGTKLHKTLLAINIFPDSMSLSDEVL